MRVDRGASDASERRSGAANAREAPSLAINFSLALQRAQSRDRSAQAGARRAEESSARSSARPTNRSDDVRGGNGVERELPESGVGEPALHLPASFVPLHRWTDRGVDSVASSAAMREPRRRRAASGDEASSCVEIEHAASGLRCVLSYQDGAWFLSFTQSPASNDDARALVQALRAHFQKSGLGAIDVIV